MRLKLFVLVSLIFISLITLIGIVNAATCSDAQRIMKLFSLTNSHGAAWNYQSTTNYLYEICSPNGEIINHGCTSSILYLFDNAANDPEYNSHVSTAQGNGYTIPVCFDGLTCRIVDESLAQYCATNEKAILSLYSNTNSHLADSNYLPSGIISLWKLDGNLIDDAGTNDNGVLNGGTANFVDGKVGRALSFDGVDDYVNVSLSTPLSLSQYTLSLWAYPKLKGTSQTDPVKQGILKLSDGTQNLRFFINPLEIEHDLSPGIPTEQGNLFADFNINEWVFLTATFDGTNVKLYKNGQLVTQATANMAISNINNIKISWQATDKYFEGSIDEVAIYNKALTPEEIQSRYNLGVYEKKICCKTAVAGNVYWANMRGGLITETQKRDTIKMIWAGTGLAQGSEVNFTIEEISLINEWVRDNTNPIKGYVDSSGNVTAFWTITDADYAKTNQHEKYVFHVSGRNSNELRILATEQNSLPVAVITTPAADAKFKKGTVISFTQASYDADDDLKVIWDFGDGNLTTLYNCQTQSCNIMHTYAEQGTKIISLKATEMTRNQYNITYRQIFIYDTGINPFPIITSPLFGMITGNRLVQFFAKNSYVAECASSCPGASCYDVDGLACYDIHARGANPGTGYNLWFDWVFSEGAGKKASWKNNGEGYNDVVEFAKTFYEPTHHWANLKLGYEVI